MRWTSVGVVAGLTAAAAFGLLGLSHRAGPDDRGSVPTTAAEMAAPAAVSPVTYSGVVPRRLTIAQQHVTAAVVPVLADASGNLAVPVDPNTLGWWAGGALPGSPAGTVVIDGHVDSAAAGPGALFELRGIRLGAVVTVSGSPSALVTYRVTGLREYDKNNLPAAEIFVRSGRPRLALITCGGPFDARTRHYRDNLVAYAVPVS